MAAVDRRTGMVRRGTTPTAPKPINLPSQKLESQGLVPDVEIVPRGTFCWGSAGRSSAASNKNNEGTDLGPLPSESTGAGDNETKVQNALVSTDKRQGLAERPSPQLSEESSASPTSSSACITLGETTVAHSISGACISDTKTDSRSPPASDAGSLPDSITRPSSSESGAATPMKSRVSDVKSVQVEEQRKSNGFPIVDSKDSVKVPNLQPKLGTHDCNESLPGSQDFGYFEGFYSNQQAFSMSGMPYSNGPGMAFGPGMHPEPSQHTGFYSFLGVPYYDSTKDKEIVVITMVGNPGFHGSYLPHPGFPDQYGRPGVYGNFPLQFGHFENFGVPRHDIPDGMPSLSADTNPMCLGEQGEFACYEQEYYKDGWVNKCPVSEMQRSNGAHLPTSFSTFKSNSNVQDYSMTRRSGGHKFPYRNKKAASSTVFTPERRVTLLTKVSQHEVVISSLQKKSRRVGNGQAVGLSGSPSFAQNTDRVDEVVDVGKSHALDTSKVPSMSEMILDQATSTGSNNEGSILVSSCNNDNLRTAFDSSSTMTSTISTSISQAHGKPAVCHEDTLAANWPGAVCQVLTAPSTNLSSVIGNKARLKREVRHVTFNVADHIMNAAGLPQDVTLNVATEFTASMEQVNEDVSGEETLSTTTAASMPREHNQGSMPVLLNQKAERKWRRKAFVAVAKPCSKGKEDVMDKKALSLPSSSDKARDVSSSAGANSLPISTMGGNPESHCSVSLSSSAAAALSGCEAAATLIQADYTEPDRLPKVKKNKKVHKRGSENGDHDSVAEYSSVQNLESSKKTTIGTVPSVDGQSLDSNRASCRFRKAWRLKHPGDKAATKVLRNQASMASTTSKIPGRQVTESCLINNQKDPKHRLEVSCHDNSKDKFKQEQSCHKHSHEDMQNKSCDRLSDSVDKEHTSRNMSLTSVTRIDNKNLRNEGERMEGCKSGESLPSGTCRVEERAHGSRLVGKQKLQQEVSPASKLEEPKHAGRVDIPMRVEEITHSSRLVEKKKLQQEVSPTSKVVEPKHAGRVDIPMRVGCCFEACGGHSSSSDPDHKISKSTKSSKFTLLTEGSQVVPALEVKEKSKENEDASHVSPQSVSQPVLASQHSKFKDLTSEVNQSSKASSGLPQQSSLRNCQEQPVKYVPRMHAGPVHSFRKDQQSAGSISRSSPANFGMNCMKQGQFAASWGENVVREGGASLDSPKNQKINQNCHHLQKGYSANAHSHLGKFQKARNYEGQSMHRWQQQKKWTAKVMHLQEQQWAMCSSASKPCEGSYTRPYDKSIAENKQYGNLLQGASGVVWKPKKSSVVEMSIEGSLEGGKDNPSTPASQKKKTPEELPVLEAASSAPISSPCGNGQQVRKQAFRKPVFQVGEASEMFPVVTSTSSTQFSPAYGNEQQANNMGKRGSVRSVPPVSPLKQIRDEGPVVMSPSCTLSSPARGNAQDAGDMVKRAPVKPASQLKMGYEDCPVVISFSSASLSSPCGNGQEVANTVKQSYKAALERQHPALSRNLTSSEEQAGPGPISQPVSSLSLSLKLEDTTINKSVKPRGHHTSWRPKAVSGSNAAKAALSKEVKENDPSASIQVERAPKKHTHPLPSSKSAELNDLHVWKNNGRHPVRASYGLPYWRKEYPQQQKSVGYRAKLHAESASSPEHRNRANEKLLEREFPRASFMKEVKHANPQMQAEMPPSREHPGSYLKFSQHRTYLAKQAQSNCNQHNAVGNCRPFSKKPNFSHDDEKKIVHYQQPFSRICTPVEQGNRRPFSTKSNFSYDDNTKVHQQSLARISMHMEQGKVRENFSIRGIGHLEGACPSRSDNKPAKRERFRIGWKVADFDRKGWVAKPETRC